MKKSKVMRIAALLMVAVLLTTCAISGTFAKYVTTGTSAAQTARVAKWGVEITAGSGAAFATTYATDDTATYDGPNSVVSSTEDLVVAPGTEGSVASLLTIAGTPEVATKIDYTGTLTLNGFDSYFPIIITVGSTEIKGTAAACVTAFAAAIDALDAVYAPNTDLAAVAPTISWEWPFETTGNDAADTALGDAAAAGSAATISFTISATATQVD